MKVCPQTRRRETVLWGRRRVKSDWHVQTDFTTDFLHLCEPTFVYMYNLYSTNRRILFVQTKATFYENSDTERSTDSDRDLVKNERSLDFAYSCFPFLLQFHLGQFPLFAYFHLLLLGTISHIAAQVLRGQMESGSIHQLLRKVPAKRTQTRNKCEGLFWMI